MSAFPSVPGYKMCNPQPVLDLHSTASLMKKTKRTQTKETGSLKNMEEHSEGGPPAQESRQESGLAGPLLPGPRTLHLDKHPRGGGDSKLTRA